MKKLLLKLALAVGGLLASVLAYLGWSNRRKDKREQVATTRAQEAEIRLVDTQAERDVEHETSTRSLADNLVRDGAGQRSRNSADD